MDGRLGVCFGWLAVDGSELGGALSVCGRTSAVGIDLMLGVRPACPCMVGRGWVDEVQSTSMISAASGTRTAGSARLSWLAVGSLGEGCVWLLRMVGVGDCCGCSGRVLQLGFDWIGLIFLPNCSDGSKKDASIRESGLQLWFC